MKIFNFEHVQLLPKRCIVKSRSECDTSIKLGSRTFKIPVVPANMKTIINEALAIEFAKRGYFYVLHRFGVDTKKFIKTCRAKNLFASISIGVKSEWFKIVEDLAKENLIPEYITIDIAHGHSEVLRNMIEHIRRFMGNKTFIIAGNVATPEGVADLERWGADATKVGVGPGRVCTTRLKTGFGTAKWQLSAIKWCKSNAVKPIIADGGIKQNGDIAKAIRFGATMVMVGSLLSAHDENPGKKIEINGTIYKEYYGSASKYNKSNNQNIEGKRELLKFKGSIWETLDHLTQDIQSAISYAGGKNITALKHTNYVLLKSIDGY